jgi:NADH:ubiquinone oxidoreductase subunit 6 (subunit J)
MAATIIIYAGAIIVTFLFVLMLAQQEVPSDADQRSREPYLATAAGGVLLIALLFVLLRTYDTRALDRVLVRAERALQQPTLDAMNKELGDTFFDDLSGALKARGGRMLDEANSAIMSLEEDWRVAKEPAQRKVLLSEMLALVKQVRGSWGDLPPDPAMPRSRGSIPAVKQPTPRDVQGRSPMPAENVAALGQSLFSDYLLAVELAGLLLTVATIGAIVIAGRHERQESGVRNQESGVRSQGSEVRGQRSEVGGQGLVGPGL